EMVHKEIEDLGIALKEALTEENLERVFEKFNFKTEDDMYAAVGYQGITGALIATRLTEKIRHSEEMEQKLLQTLEDVKGDVIDKGIHSRKGDSGVQVEGISNLLVRLSKCCNPVPGDEVVGYIT